jgi:outer membrane murein-binding lipoprotein Lpp
MQSQIRAINSMAQQLAAITEATRDTATAAKKTAQRVN